jgi:putative hydrolase of the HAD superfamily
MTWILFDYGNVISQPQPASDIAHLAAVAGCRPAEFAGAYWADRLAYDLAELDQLTYWQKVAARAGRPFSAAQIAELARLDIASWQHLRPQMLVLIDGLAAAGYRLALLSNAPVEVAEAIRTLPFATRFSQLAFSCFLGLAKPDPLAYQAVLTMLETSPDEVIFIDDRPENVAGARAAGMRAIHFTEPGQVRADLARLGVAAGANWPR